MSLADRLSGPAPDPRKIRCHMCLLLATLDDADKDAVTTAMADPAWSASAIANALRAEGHQLMYYTVRRHRRGECRGAH